jgi:L-galactose dehydrogenase/L-glyceraldehyde 3-phosphate reductase
MDYRSLGNTGLRVSALGFGCGAVGGLLVQGDSRDMVAAVARAVEAGITYFDTAQLYGDGRSETNLGRVLAAPRGRPRPNVIVGTKMRLGPGDTGAAAITSAIVAAVEVSLRRLGMERLDLFQLHNPIGVRRAGGDRIGLDDLESAAAAFRHLQTQGKIAAWGINGIGETGALHQAVATAGAGTIQIPYNLLNPSAGRAMPQDFAFQDYRQLIRAATDKGMGVIAIRVLAGGALSGETARHPVGAASVAPIATGADYAADVAHAQRLRWLVDDGYAASLPEAAIRFALGQPGIATALVGLSSLAQLEQAIAAAERGPLPAAVLARIG